MSDGRWEGDFYTAFRKRSTRHEPWIVLGACAVILILVLLEKLL